MKNLRDPRSGRRAPAFILASLLVAVAALGVTTAARAWDAVHPNLSGLSVDVDIRYHPDGYYEYAYRLRNDAPSTGALLGFAVDVTGSPDGASPPTDGAGRFLGNFAAVKTVLPVGFGIPEAWRAALTRNGEARWSIDARDANGDLVLDQMAPGQGSPPLILRSREAPGVRTFRADPFWDSTDPATTFVDAGQAARVGTVLGPTPDGGEEEVLFRGGSNNPSVIDPLLSYRIPSTKTTRLAPGDKAVVVVHFKENVLPETFRATWNGEDVTSRFGVAAGHFAAVTLDPVPGRNVLLLSVSGVKPGGGTGTDSDRLLWEAP